MDELTQMLEAPSAPRREAASPTPRRPGMGAVIFTLAGAVFCGLVFAEVFLRLFVPVIDIAFIFWDPVMGLRREPNQAGRNIQGADINARYNFNAQGWNHPRNYQIEKPKGGRRICVVGDSQVESYQVDVDKTFCALAEQKMSRADRPVEWYAFGCSGLGPSQEYQIIRHYALDYEPDMVVMLFVENDPHDSSPYVFPVEEYISTFYLGDDGDLVLMPPKPWHPKWYRRLSASSALVRYFTIQKNLLRGKPSPHVLQGIFLREGVFSRENIHRVPGIERMSAEERQESTWKLVEKIIQAARDDCKRRGAKFALAFRGHTLAINAALEGKPYSAPPKEADPFCLQERLFEMGKERLEPMAARLGIPYLDLTQPICDLVARTKKSHVFANDGHWNGATHEVAATVLSEWTESLLNEPASK